ncbi:MAG: nucleotide exchange factor GrpE [Hyphomonadaceae bacterium]|nr:nucleotide exchange factor GrpE [Hyphomonadaceae bacterium]
MDQQEQTEANTAPDSTASAAPPAEAGKDSAAELADVKDQLLRALAEVDNVRKRGERAAQEARVFAIERFARDLMAIADNLQRALHSAPESQDEAVATLVEGVRMTERSLLETFARHGLKPVGAKGDRFDPTLHQAVAQTPSDAPAGAIAEVFQVGFVLGERTVRPAMVAVSAGAASAASPGGVDVTA